MSPHLKRDNPIEQAGKIQEMVGRIDIVDIEAEVRRGKKPGARKFKQGGTGGWKRRQAIDWVGFSGANRLCLDGESRGE